MKRLRLIAITVVLVCMFGSAKSNSRNDSSGIKDSTERKIDTLIAHMGLSSTSPGGVVSVSTLASPYALIKMIFPFLKTLTTPPGEVDDKPM